MKRAAILLLFLFPFAANAWTPATDERIARKAAALAPPDLALLIRKMEGDYKAGLDRARSEEGHVTHHDFPSPRGGKLRERIDLESKTAVRMIRKGDPMSRVIERLGILAHLVADANNPFHVANDDRRLAQSQSDFERYAAQQLTRVPTVFYGLDPRPEVGPVVDRAISRTRSFYPLISEEYFRGGVRHTSAEFDDRSTAFGVASVCYSHAITDMVNLEYFIWKEAGGNVRRAPQSLVLNGN